MNQRGTHEEATWRQAVRGQRNATPHTRTCVTKSFPTRTLLVHVLLTQGWLAHCLFLHFRCLLLLIHSALLLSTLHTIAYCIHITDVCISRSHSCIVFALRGTGFERSLRWICKCSYLTFLHALWLHHHMYCYYFITCTAINSPIYYYYVITCSAITSSYMLCDYIIICTVITSSHVLLLIHHIYYY